MRQKKTITSVRRSGKQCPTTFRRRLQNACRTGLRPSASGSTRNRRPARGRISQWIGGLTMRQRIAAFGGVGVAAILGLLLLWGGIDHKPVSAMEKMAENIRKAKSYKCDPIVRISKTESLEIRRSKVQISRHVTYWLAPARIVRTYTIGGAQGRRQFVSAGVEGAGARMHADFPIGKPGIMHRSPDQDVLSPCQPTRDYLCRPPTTLRTWASFPVRPTANWASRRSTARKPRIPDRH